MAPTGDIDEMTGMAKNGTTGTASRLGRLPFFYGWVIVAISFVTMAVAVNTRTAFSLLYPSIVDEFHWDRGLAAGAFSFGFLMTAALSPFVGMMVDRYGPRPVVELGVLLMAGGLLLATTIQEPWQLYLSLGFLVGGGANCAGYSVQSQYLPLWFVRRRGLAVGLAFSGVGFGSILLLPWVQSIIQQAGWRASCWALGILVVVVLGPLNLFIWRRPQSIGLEPDGAAAPIAGSVARKPANIVDQAWVETEWTLVRAMRTSRFWWLASGYFCALFSWYAVQVHQTKYLIEIGFDPIEAAWALGLVGVVSIPGQVAFGALSDRIGRESVWTIGCAGFVICYAALILLESSPTRTLLYAMVLSQGVLGYALTAVMGPIVTEIFEGPRFGVIFGTITIALLAGGAAGPWVMGVVHDLTGSYQLAFIMAIACSIFSALAVWFAAPRRVRLVPGRVRPQK